MLAAGMLAHVLRAARQRRLDCRALAAATTTWQPLQLAGAPSGDSLAGASIGSGSSRVLSGGSSFGSSLKGAGGFGGSSFSSSAVLGSTPRGPSDGSSGKSKRGRRTHTKEPQPQLQTWLQQEQGLSAKAADEHARRLAHIFGSQQAALEGLPATFEWCRSCGLTGPQTAQLLDGILGLRHDSAVQFAALVQPVWQLLDSYISAYVEPLRQAGARLPKHTSLAEVLCNSTRAADALAMPPGHVEAWLAAVSQRLPAAAGGRLVLTNPLVLAGSPATAVAAINWAVSELGVADPAVFFSGLPTLLMREVPTMQRNLDSLQQTLGWTAEQARQLVCKHPQLLQPNPSTVQAALAWLQQLFSDAAQLADVIGRGPQLLTKSVQRLQGNADTLRQALGWQEGNSQLAAFVAAYPQPFAINDLGGEGCAHKLRLLTRVAGISTERCLAKGTGYLKTGLETMAAHYMLVQGRAPHLLVSKAGGLQLSWIVNADKPCYLAPMGISQVQRNAFVQEWPRSPEGLLEGLRAGSVEGWPRPPTWEEAQQRRAAAAAAAQHAAAGATAKQPQRRRKA